MPPGPMGKPCVKGLGKGSSSVEEGPCATCGGGGGMLAFVVWCCIDRGYCWGEYELDLDLDPDLERERLRRLRGPAGLGCDPTLGKLPDLV